MSPASPSAFADSLGVNNLGAENPRSDGALPDPAAPECPAAADAAPAGAIELSIVMPCLNEAETLATCVAQAQQALRDNGIVGEVIVADNGSTDGSPEIARRLGARVAHVGRKGYGSALQGGIAAARGRYVLMGDADDSYNFLDAPRFLSRLREGFDLVLGNRFRGGISPGAMPWKHRWIGNPALTGLSRVLFGCPTGDVYCGLRGFSKAAYERLDLSATGMEFATEMVIKGALHGLRIAEVPTTLKKDGRSRPPHLRTWRDGWRTLRFMLLFSPRWLFLVPGGLLFLLGLAVLLTLLGGPLYVGGVGFDVHTMQVAGFACVLGYQLLIFAAFTKLFAVQEGLHPPSPRFEWARSWFSLERGVLAGLGLLLAAGGLLGAAAWHWSAVGFGALDPLVTMRQVIPAVLLATLGTETIFGSFLLGVLSLRRGDT